MSRCDIIRYDKAACISPVFESTLSRGVPLCINEFETKLQGEWDPDAFSREYGDLKVCPIDALTGTEVEGDWHADAFFDILARDNNPRHPLKLKACSFILSIKICSSIVVGLASQRPFRQHIWVTRQRLRHGPPSVLSGYCNPLRT